MTSIVTRLDHSPISEVPQPITLNPSPFFPMTSPITLNHQVLKDSLEMVSQLNKDTNWKQSNATYDLGDFVRCCIGAHIAKHFNVQNIHCDNDVAMLFSDEEYFFKDGIDHLCEQIGTSQTTLEYLLYICGAPFGPFSGKEWYEEPQKVWERMMSIEKVINEEALHDLCVDYWNKGEEKSHLSIIVHREEFKNILEFNS